MASKVNTRFVIILVVGVIALFALLMVAYGIVYKSPADLAKRGDELMSQGEYFLAEKAYSKAVNKETTNTENLYKWIGSLEMIVPETETEYSDRFFGDYTNALLSTAKILRKDIDAHERFLEIGFQQLNTGYRRGYADRLIESTSKALAYFSDTGEAVQDWERLKRYRGLAILDIAKHGELVESDQYTLATDDLERALAANPSDVDSAIGLINLRSIVANAELIEDDVQGSIGILDDGIQAADAFLIDYPQSVAMRIQRIFLNINRNSKAIFISVPKAEQNEAIMESFASYHDEIGQIAAQLLGESRDQLEISMVEKFHGMEATIAPSSQLTWTRQLIDTMIDSDPDNARLLLIAGKVAKDVNDTDEAIGWYARIGELKTKPLSYDGYLQYGYQREALASQASIMVDRALALPTDVTDADRETTIAIAKENLGNYASVVTEENLTLMMLNGKMARAQGSFDEALRLFKKFNEQTQRTNPDGLWQEGGTAAQLGQYGVAREAYTEMILHDKTRRRTVAMLALAQIDVRLKDYESAAGIYRDVLATNPTLAPAVEGLNRVNKWLNPDQNDDPIEAAVYTSRQLRQGTSDRPADHAGAVQYLREAVVTNDYAPQLAIELASLLLDSQDIIGAREVLAESLERNPDNELVAQMAKAASSSDTTDILIEMVQLSERSDLDKNLAIARIAVDNDRQELLKNTITALNVEDPNNTQVIELSFIQAIKYETIESAKAIANREGLSQSSSLSFKARIAAMENDFPRAIGLLNQAVAGGFADAATHQMLAVYYRNAGQLEDSIQAFESSLAIRPDNAQAVTDYVLTLVQASRFEEALNTARRLQRYGNNNSTFMKLWLNLEAEHGGVEGRTLATRQRERMLELNPDDLENKYQLGRMYVASKQWDEARSIIDDLRANHDRLVFVELDALWYADQGIFNNQDGVVLANAIYAKYIQGLEEPVGPESYISNAEFMLSRGRPDLAVLAATEAQKHQDKSTMLGSRLLGDIYSRINNQSEAVKAYQEVIDNGADADFSIHYRMVETLTRLGRYEEAAAVFAKLPEENTTSMISMILEADIATGLGEKAKASRLLDEAVAQHPNESYTYIKRAESMIGDETLLNDMLSDLSRALDLRSNDWRAYRIRASGYFAVDRRDDGIKDLKAVVRMNPNLNRSINSLLNELLNIPGREGEALDVAVEVIQSRPDDAGLMSRIGGIFSSRGDWDRASTIYQLAWEKRHSVNDGAVYIDSLVRKSPPDAAKANEVIKAIAKMVGDINTSPGLLAAQALVLQARGRDDFAQQQMTKAFDISLDKDSDLINWSTNLSRYFEGQKTEDHVAYLDALKRRNTIPEIHAWLDLFIAQSYARETVVNERAFEIFERLEAYTENNTIQQQAFTIHGSLLFAQDQFLDAAKVWERGLEVFSDDWGMNNNLAYVYATELDRLDDSLVYGQRAIDKNINRSEAYETMAGIYIQLGKLDEAEQMIESGSLYLRGIAPRVTMLITAGRLEIARGNPVEARSKLNDARSVLRASSTAHTDLEEDIDLFELEIDSAEG